jgi:hypothetical protein
VNTKPLKVNSESSKGNDIPKLEDIAFGITPNLDFFSATVLTT